MQLFPRHAGELKGHVGDFDDGFAVGIHNGIGNRIRCRSEAELFDRNLISGDSRRLNDLTPALEPAGDTWNWLPSNVLLLADPAHTHEINSQRMQTALVHQRAGHDSIINEMAGQEPTVGMDIGLRTDDSPAISPSLRIEIGHTINQLHPAAR